MCSNSDLESGHCHVTTSRIFFFLQQAKVAAKMLEYIFSDSDALKMSRRIRLHILYLCLAFKTVVVTWVQTAPAYPHGFMG